ncbi:MAG: hypothetical protein A2751_01640 [Candidatus Doudnabacteria bacterium RIFCSPHIGHO2_01_FULL_46_14]|uniref:NIF system FeS cluster assembly NifU N-terminal domain-containing protein n=1 Tax=Candidatus Doudnabacteria bacterium RIFCSPHIGHO2_01_FULL_46_14 TaxID=1817824 RepID=A0A1F5NJR6_9BACT|nr:MAG: hypothetical protein A2751_01640 [Candidatus Doudnabacteria bacterium RIFCSPHIGHO2_01_FULL_46_14]
MTQHYSETIKQHYHHPLNSGKLDNADFVAEQVNPLCGDETKVYIKFIIVENSRGRGNFPQSDLVIQDISHETRGCMICVASASAVSEYARGKKLSEIKKLGIKQISKLLNVQISSARASCANLIHAALKKLG